MLEDRSIFIIPGFGQSPFDPEYKKIARILGRLRFHVIPVVIPWRKTTISQNTKYFLEEFKKDNTRKKYILGFSFGAMIAFISATKVEVEGIILCSMSPYFKEDLTNKKNNAASKLAKLRYQDFSKLHCSTLARKTKAKQIFMMYGQEEAKSLIKRMNEAFDKITKKNKRLIEIEKAEHDIGDRRYLNKIHEVSSFLN